MLTRASRFREEHKKKEERGKKKDSEGGQEERCQDAHSPDSEWIPKGLLR
jgi:hypothetical protein